MKKNINPEHLLEGSSYHWSKSKGGYYLGHSDYEGDINYFKTEDKNLANKNSNKNHKPSKDYFNVYFIGGAALFWILVLTFIAWYNVGSDRAWEVFRNVSGGLVLIGVIGYFASNILKVATNEYNLSKKNKEKTKKNIPSEKEPNLEGASGTGFFINQGGYAVTNYHVVGEAKEVKMSTKGKTYNASIIAKDKVNDLAILKAKERNSSFFKFSKIDADRMDDVTAVGYGFGKSMSDEIKTTKGVVSALAGLGNNYSQIQIDAALQPGNSGGPVININGDIIGVAVAKADAVAVFQYTGTIAEGISFAIKVSTLKQFLKSNKIIFEESDGRDRDKREINELIDNAALYIFH